MGAWTGEGLMLFAKGLGRVYDPATNEWDDLPDPGFYFGNQPPVWTGSQLLFVGPAFEEPSGLDVASITPAASAPGSGG